MKRVRKKKLSNNTRLQQHQKICEKHIEIDKIRQGSLYRINNALTQKTNFLARKCYKFIPLFYNINNTLIKTHFYRFVKRLTSCCFLSLENPFMPASLHKILRRGTVNNS